MKNSFLAMMAAALLGLQGLQAQTIDIRTAEDYSPYIFGYNIEHTRSAVYAGLSAQMLRNRKFAGKPSRDEGVPAEWFGIGEKVFFQQLSDRYTLHMHLDNMPRNNELFSQEIQNMNGGRIAGMGQRDLFFSKGVRYGMRVVTKVSAPVNLKVELTDRDGGKVYASQTLALAPSDDWVVSAFTLIPSVGNPEGCVRYTFTEQARVQFGALSMMPEDNFHGMRSDVVALLKELGPKMLRWPGGNFAGEYRWKDGLLPVDRRGPLQAATRVETQPHSFGYDYHEIGTDEFIALCREVGAEPMITINLVWNTPEESAQWVEYCNGGEDTEYGRIRAERGFKEPFNVRFWSLGNEIGYSHMEGPSDAAGYAELAEAHADAMLKADAGLEFCAAGSYSKAGWIDNAAVPLADKVRYIPLHRYANPSRQFTTPQEIKDSYEKIVRSALNQKISVEKLRANLDATGKRFHISFDEWNQWYAWYRPSCVAEGVFTALSLHLFINESNALDMPVACYFQPVNEGAVIVTPEGSSLTANGQMMALMKAHQGGKVCKVADNEDYAVAATLKDKVLTVTLINAEYEQDRAFSFNIPGKVVEARLFSSDDVRPYTDFTESPLDLTATRKSLRTVLPPHSAAIVKVALK